MDEITKIFFLQWQQIYENEKPYQDFMSGQEEDPEFRDRDLVFAESPPLTVHDLRGKEAEFTLDQNGFAVPQHRSAMKAFDTIEEFQNVYLPEMEKLIHDEVDGVDRIFIFDWRVSMVVRLASLSSATRSLKSSFGRFGAMRESLSWRRR